MTAQGSSENIVKKIVCRALGPPEGLLLEEAPSPHIEPHQVRIAVRATSCNRNELLKLAGDYQQKAELPYTPGSDAAGVVSAVGAAVGTLKIGDRVMAMLEGSRGAWAEEIAVRADWTVKIPDSMSFAQAAGFASSYVSAYESLVHTANTTAEDVVLITGAGGGLGLAAVEIARAIGATIIAVAGSDERLASAKRSGADHLINHRKESMRDRVMEITNQRGANVIIEVVGGDMLKQAQRCIAWRGRLAVTGFASFDIPDIRPIIVLLKAFDLRGANLYQTVVHQPRLLTEYCTQLFTWFERGRLRPLVSKTFPMQQAAAAIRYVERGGHAGKVVIEV